MGRTKQKARKGKNKQNGAPAAPRTQSQGATPRRAQGGPPRRAQSEPSTPRAPTAAASTAPTTSSLGGATVHAVHTGRVTKSGKKKQAKLSKQAKNAAKKAAKVAGAVFCAIQTHGGIYRRMSEMPHTSHTVTLPAAGKASRMNGSVELPLSEDTLHHLLSQAKDFMFANGLVMRTAAAPGDADRVQHAPFTLLPSPVPRHCFMHAQDIQQDINILMYKVAHDYDFLKNCLKSAIKNDDFTSKLWDIYEQVRKAEIQQPFDLAVLRSDYMLDSGIPTADLIADNSKVNISQLKVKQIEINTIASSFGGLSSRMVQYHRYMLGQLHRPQQARTQIPPNKAADCIATGMVKAWKLYKQQEIDSRPPENMHFFRRPAAILFVVQEKERNIYDQRFLEYAIEHLHPGLTVLRMTIADLYEAARLDTDNRLFVGDMEIAVVYLRALYTPNDLNSHRDWSVRLLLERSLAIKCPSVNYQLAGTKKVQQELSRPGVLERYVDNPRSVQRIRDSFTGQFSLDMGEEGDATVTMAMASPEKYVLKPQREGGGNNIFGADIKTTLEEIGQTEERTAYVLMERVHPVPVENYPVLPGHDVSPQPTNMVSELGIFGVFLGSAEKTILNADWGFILRTKPVGVDEGGVATGYSSIDSPYIVDDPDTNPANPDTNPANPATNPAATPTQEGEEEPDMDDMSPPGSLISSPNSPDVTAVL